MAVSGKPLGAIPVTCQWSLAQANLLPTIAIPADCYIAFRMLGRLMMKGGVEQGNRTSTAVPEAFSAVRLCCSWYSSTHSVPRKDTDCLVIRSISAHCNPTSSMYVYGVGTHDAALLPRW